MRNKRRRKQRAAERDAAKQPTAQGVGTAMGPLLERAGLHRLDTARPQQSVSAPPPAPAKAARGAEQRAAPAPSPAQPAEPELSPRELALLHQAYAGVDPIRRPKRGRVERPRRAGASRAAPDDAEEAAARARLSQLVGGGVRFEVSWDDELVQGLRAGAARKLLARLSGSAFAPEAQLDLHGLRGADVERAVSEFVRREHRRGLRRLLIIPGKGQHSEGGVGVLGPALVGALSGGSAAPLVLAFASAHARHGGSGAVAVLLE